MFEGVGGGGGSSISGMIVTKDFLIENSEDFNFLLYLFSDCININ